MKMFGRFVRKMDQVTVLCFLFDICIYCCSFCVFHSFCISAVPCKNVFWGNVDREDPD